MKKNILGWLDKRETSETLKLAKAQMKKALDTVYELDKSIREASQGDFESSMKAIEKVFLMEEEVDRLRREVFHRLTQVELKTRDREDLLHFIKRLDVMADHVKDSARSVRVLLESEEIPIVIWDNLIKMSKNIVGCATSLRTSIEKLEYNIEEAKKLSLDVDQWEHKVDDQNLNMRILLINESKKIDLFTLITIRDLLTSMEEVADSCADTADYIRVLIAGGIGY